MKRISFALCTAALALSCATSPEKRGEDDTAAGDAPANEASSEATADGRVVGNGYSAEVPEGFSVDRESAAPAILLRRDNGEEADLLRLMGPLPSAGMEDERACYEFATGFAGAGGASVSLSNVRVGTLQESPTCRFRADRASGEEHGPVHIENAAVFTPHGLFIVVGTSASEGEGITRALDEVMESWRLEGPPRVEGNGFSIPVPAGYAPAPPQVVQHAPGAAAVMAQERIEAARAFLASVVAAPAASAEVTWTDEDGCTAFGEAMAKQLGDPTLEESVLTEVNGQTTCRVQVSATDRPERKAVFHPLAVGEQIVVVTCNVDERDDAAEAACAEVVRGLTAG